MARISEVSQELAIVQAFDLILQALKVSLAGVTTTNVSGKDSLDVNVTNIALNSNEDSIAIKSPTTGQSIEPNTDGSLSAQITDPIIREALRQILKLRFMTTGSGQALYAMIDTNSSIVPAYASMNTSTTNQLESQKNARTFYNGILTRT